MEKLILSDKEICNLKELGHGSEGTVFLYDDLAIKYYNRMQMSTECMENKIGKIERLSEKTLDDFALPKDAIYNSNGELKGYSMKYYKSESDMQDYMLSNNYSLDQKIEKLKKLEKLIKNAHEQGITLVDTHFWNFLLVDDEIKIVDTDNYKVDNYKHDIEPAYFCRYFRDKISFITDSDIDKFTFGIHIINLLSNGYFYQDFTLAYNTLPYDYVVTYITMLDIDPRLRDFLFDLVSNNKEKKYFNEYLDMLSSSESFIKSKR
jgi:hypothetical protein